MQIRPLLYESMHRVLVLILFFSSERRGFEILERICNGQGKEEDLALLEEISYAVKDASMCGLGQTLPNPVLTTLRYFKDEYEAHIREKRCPAKVCKALITFDINEEKCTGCTLCAKNCPVEAISGVRKEPHKIELRGAKRKFSWQRAL